jgi:hypothetical protein
MGVIIFNILVSILQFSGTSLVQLYIWLKLIQIRLRICQNGADPTGFGSDPQQSFEGYLGTDMNRPNSNSSCVLKVFPVIKTSLIR